MPIDVQMPDGTVISGVPDNITQAELLSRYQAYTPPKEAAPQPDEMGRYIANQPPAVSAPDTGFTGALSSSTEQIQADIARLQGKIGLKDVNQAEQEAKSHELKAKQAFKPTEEGWLEAPLTKLKETAGGSLPYMAAPVAAGIAAAALPEVGLVGGLVTTADVAAGLVSALQFTGSNLSRQVQEGKKLEDTSLLKAGAAAVPQALLDVVGLHMLPGIGSIFEQAGVKATEKEIKNAVDRSLLQQAGDYAIKTGKTMTAEGLTEAGQQVFERLQAGLDLTDADARQEYFDNFIGGAALGGAFAVPGHAYTAIKGKDKAEVVADAKEDAEKGGTIAKEAAVQAQQQAPTVAPSQSHDTQAMRDELSGKEIKEPAEQAGKPTTAPEAPGMDMQPMIAATTNLTNVLQQATVGYNIALNRMTGAEQAKTLNQVKTYLTNAFGNFLTPKQTEEYVNYLVNEGGLAESDMGTNHGLFGEAVNNFGGKVTPKEEATAEEPKEEAVSEAPTSEEKPAEAPKYAVDDSGEKLSHPMFVDMANKGYQLYSFENPRTYENKGGTRYRTLEKDGVRIALEPQQVLFTDPKKPYQQPQLGMGNEDDVAFHFIGVDPEMRKQGRARKALQDLIEVADKNNYTLYGEPAQLEKEGMNKEQLTALYADYGFKPSDDTGKVIIREPGAKVAPKAEAKPAIPKLQTKHTEFEINKSPKEIHDEVKDMTNGEQISNWLIQNAPNEAAKHIAEGIQRKVKAYAKIGIPVKVTILEGDKRNPEAYGSQKPVFNKQTAKFSHFDVKYNGLSARGLADAYTGTDYETIMHEMGHAISTLQIHFLKQSVYPGDKAIYNELKSIRNSIARRVKEELAKPRSERHPGMANIRNALDIEKIVDGKIVYGRASLEEMFTYGLTQGPVRDFFATIKSGKTTVLSELAKIFRKLLGVNPKYQTALDRLSGVADYFMNETTEDVNKILNKVGATLKKTPEETFSKINEVKNISGEPVEPTWTLPEDKIVRPLGISDQLINSIIYRLQDKQIDTKRVQEAIQKNIGQIDDKLNVYDKEQLYHGKVATGIRDFLLNELLPAVKLMFKLKISPKELVEFLHNRHAEERNNRMNELNKNDPITGEARTSPWELQDKASGIHTKDARAYLAGLDPKRKEALEEVADLFDKMIRGTQQVLVNSGAETQDTIDSWNSIFKNYVPLFRKEEDFSRPGIGKSGVSKGFATSGKFSKRALGSAKEVVDIVGSIIAQRERALIRAEKIQVGRALYALALENPNPDVWMPINPDAIKSKPALIKELMDFGYDKDEAFALAENLVAEPQIRYISKTKNRKIDPNTGLPTSETEESIKLKTDTLARFGEYALPVRINGKDRYVLFNKNNPVAERMVQSLKNLDVEGMNAALGMAAKATRWFANVNTQYNPVFGVVNLIRDLGSATINLSSTPIADQKKKVLSQVMPAMGGIIQVLRKERSGIARFDENGKDIYEGNKWAQIFHDFREAGGQTGYRGSLIRTDQDKQIIQHELDKLQEGNAKKAFTYILGALTDFNDMMENAIRVSAYQTAIDQKISPQKAAIIAKNITVNFDKKGQLSSNINALWAFFNASVQGSARIYQTLTGPAGKKIMAGGVLLGSMQAVLLAAAGYRDDEPPEFVRERNFIIPLPNGKYFGIPYPLGYNVFPNTGRLTTQFILGGGKHGAKYVGYLLNSFMDAFNPLGSSDLAQTISPTIVDPIVALYGNKDAFGRPIYKEDKATNPTPGYMRSREGASAISKQLSYFFNLASGGGKYSKGYFSPTADEIDYVAGQFTGGLGREIMKGGEAIHAAATGEELPPYRIPLAGRFYGDTKSNAAETSRFYNNITRMADHENEVKGRQKNHENVFEYYKEHPEARYYQMANTVENEVNALNKQKKEFIEKGLPKERIQRLEKQKVEKMKRFNDILRKYE